MRPERWMRWSVRAASLALVAAYATSHADQDRAAPGSFRAAQDQGLDFSLRPVDLLNVDPGRAAPGSYRAAQEIGNPWSQRLGQGWSGEGYQGPGGAPPWAGGKEQPLGSGTRRF